MKSSHVFPLQLDLLKSADQEFSWQGAVPFDRFKRLSAHVLLNNKQLITVDCTLTKTDRQIPWFKARVTANLVVACGRCLEPLDITLEESLDYAILTDESFCSRLSQTDEYIVLSEEAQAHGTNHAGDVNLLALMEDELLLSILSESSHEACPKSLPLKFGPEIEVVQSKENPFDVLAALKSKPNTHS